MTSTLRLTGVIADLAADVTGRPDDRPPLLLLHGLTFDRRMWRPAVAELESLDPGRRTIALDLPGHGESPDAPAYDLRSTVDRIRRVVVEGGLSDPVLVGHSASAAHVAMYAAEYPTRGIVEVEGGFVVAPFVRMLKAMEPRLRGDGFGDAWAAISGQAFRLSEVNDDVRAFVEATSRPRTDVALDSWRDLFELSVEDLEAWIVSAAVRIRAAGVPVLSVVGAEPSADEAAWLRANLPDAQTLAWPASGHFPHLAHPARFARVLASTASWSAGQRPAVAA